MQAQPPEQPNTTIASPLTPGNINYLNLKKETDMPRLSLTLKTKK